MRSDENKTEKGMRRRKNVRKRAEHTATLFKEAFPMKTVHAGVIQADGHRQEREKERGGERLELSSRADGWVCSALHINAPSLQMWRL